MKLTKTLSVIVGTCIFAAGAIFVSIYYIPHFSPNQQHSSSKADEFRKLQ